MIWLLIDQSKKTQQEQTKHMEKENLKIPHIKLHYKKKYRCNLQIQHHYNIAFTYLKEELDD